MQRREISAALIGVAGAAALLPRRAEAQSCSALCYPLTPAEQTQSSKVVNTAYPPGNILRYKSTATGANHTDAIQAALDLNEIVEIPGGEFEFTHLVWRFRRTIRGKGPRWSVLKQSGIVNPGTPALTFEPGVPPVVAPLNPPGVPADISEGAYRADGFCVSVASDVGIAIGQSSYASMFMSDQFRIISQYINNNYVPQAGQTGIRIEAGMTSSVFVANHRNLEIRGFDIGIWAQGDEAMINGVLVVNGVNEWSIHGWLLDNRIAVRLHHCSTWNLDALSIETSVIGARAYQLFKSVANILITGGRWELNAANSFGIEGDGTVYGGNIRVRGVNLGISGDNGSTIPGRKWTGVLPGDTVFEGSDVNGPFVVVPGQIAVRLPNSLKIGGQNLGNGKVFLASNSGTAASTIEQNGTNFSIASTNSVKVYGNSATNERLEVTGSRVIFAGVDGPSGHVGALRLGANSYLWVDINGRLRIKTGAPSTNTDGFVVGSQS